ncbi:MAG: Antilisterial bacteriocin subtilosin biosynthesis protein AlbA [Pelotomaculum sp. PtaB.Bin013]|uniref:Arsenosugar biosynthesis radical SAM protein ArsS n=1 Tax=Pelotomaculum isophthalicicum JI TaxID=947010 RepID=A0A9X4JVM4_9FIRM|nr:arsenosugar biosynthesis radical SAM (seleno)protein ArsS [Pelotomaculum isophthalicicum]MDF9407647.1 arsenosugar biosynthesis radical SAM protein ArsS [Pelotomaculum isophthalicicum JI]OPX85208.1 MAG: Antilisterial bacteriocin subtilosin biosynthesis protein AlbA [Pelotomaculum sp. PtaB.Bin013]
MSLSLKAPQRPQSDSEKQLEFLRETPGVTPIVHKFMEAGLFPLRSNGISVMQVNMGKVCNLSCKHCHVEAGPERTESMSRKTVSSCLSVLAGTGIPTLDITGGAPELNPNLGWLIEEAVKLGRKVMVRTNLTVLELEEYAQLAELYARNKVEVVASLPYYLGKNTDRQRGDGVFEASIRVLRRMNELGYGREQSGLRINLVYNPGGAFLPPAQHSIETEFRREMTRRYGIVFNKLFTLTNVPIGRFLNFLMQSGNLEDYLVRLAGAFNPAAAELVMCRSQISVGWDGRLYDCDFNQALGLTCTPDVPGYIHNFDLTCLRNRPIMLDNHCYACTAGLGSSCGGAVLEVRCK